MPATGSVRRARRRSTSLERLGRAANAVCKFNLHLGPVSLGTRGLSINRGLKLGADGGGLGVGVDAVAVLSAGECGAVTEAYVRHLSKWYALQPVANPPRAFGNLLRQVDADYSHFLPTAVRVDASGFYERLLANDVLPALRELGWSDAKVLHEPGFIYGQFRIQASIGGELEVKYGAKDDDGFEWYGVMAGMAVGHDLRVGTAVGLLLGADDQPLHLAEACQVRIGVGHLRLSFVLSKRALGLRRSELDVSLHLASVALIPALPRRLVAGRGHVRGLVVLEGLSAAAQGMSLALETALAGALSGLLGEGCIAVGRAAEGPATPDHTGFAFDVFLEDRHDIGAARSALLAEGACAGARRLLPALGEALDAEGFAVGHLRVVQLTLSDSRSDGAHGDSASAAFNMEPEA